MDQVPPAPGIGDGVSFKPPTLTLEQIRDQINDVAQKDESPVVVDRFQFLNWSVSLDTILPKRSPN